jgi:3-oxoacyl-[acyl-carrier-protein] synthase-3
MIHGRPRRLRAVRGHGLSGLPRFSLADLGETAGRRALDVAGMDPAEVDLMILSTATPDQLMPATVNLIADRLGVDGVPTYQLQSGCTGALQALDLARKLLAAGEHHTALVIGGDVCAKHLDFDRDFAAMPPAQQVNFVLFGDGAGATVLRTTAGPTRAVAVREVFVRLVGRGRAPGQTVEWFGLTDRDSTRPAVTEDYKAIQQSVPVMAEEILDELLDRLDWKKTDVDYILPPQLSGRMTTTIMDRLDVGEAREISCVRETGNIGNAMPFVQLERLLPGLSPGDRAVGIAVESSKWLKSGLALERVR